MVLYIFILMYLGSKLEGKIFCTETLPMLWRYTGWAGVGTS